MPLPPPLTSRIIQPAHPLPSASSSTTTIPRNPPTPDPLDIFSSSLPTLYPDDVQNSHGTPGSYVTYRSPRFGDVVLHVPRHPDGEEGRKLFAHYLWNAGVVMAEGVERGSQDSRDGRRLGEGIGAEEEENKEAEGSESGGADELWKRRYWDVRDQSVLELGAGTALPSLLSALSGAATVTITDHPTSPSLTTDAILRSVRENITVKQQRLSNTTTPTNISIHGHTWGTPTFYSTSSYGTTVPTSNRNYTRILVADCLWMASQHDNLLSSIRTFLAHTTNDSENNTPQDSTKTIPCALIVAGFHTGRRIVSAFFDLITTEGAEGAQGDAGSSSDIKEGKERLHIASIFELDVFGRRRAWVAHERAGETKDDAKAWCVVAVIVWQEGRGQEEGGAGFRGWEQ